VAGLLNAYRKKSAVARSYAVIAIARSLLRKEAGIGAEGSIITPTTQEKKIAYKNRLVAGSNPAGPTFCHVLGVFAPL
jgi:hypothetical protein